MNARRRLLRWANWFAVANAALLAVVGLRYLWYYFALTPSPAWLYAILAYVGHMTVLAYVPRLLVLVPVMMLIPRPPVIRPTRLGGLFGCANPPADYASGHDLFADGQWEWLIAASYADYALIEPERVTIAYPAGYEVRDRDYRLVRSPRIPLEVVGAALHEMSRFYR